MTAADVPFRFSALTGSCVVIPCSIPYQEDEPFTRGVWSKRNNDIIYHNGQTFVVDHFRGHTSILGDLNEGNCSLEIDDIKPFDNGPFCFHLMICLLSNQQKHSALCFTCSASPDKPMMTSVPAEVDAGSTITVSCSVTHTCPSHPPVFSWSVPHLTSEVTHTWTPQGIWETTSTITFMAAGGDGVKNLTCTAISWGGKQRSYTIHIFSSFLVIQFYHTLSNVYLLIHLNEPKLFQHRQDEGNPKQIWDNLKKLTGKLPNDITKQIEINDNGCLVKGAVETATLLNSYFVNSVKEIVNCIYPALQDLPSIDVFQPVSQPVFSLTDVSESDLNDGDDYMNTADLNIYGNI
uniref:Ig-like domain-containing protein n=1 Tax=Sander lucioperca TaxID=283035 RepID=A0A8C9Z8N7_SANLU